MDLSLAAVLAACLLFGVLMLFGGLQTRGPNDVVLIFLLVFCQFYALRPLLFVLGLDTPSPDNQFFDAEVSQTLTVTLVGISLFLGVTLLVVYVVNQLDTPGWGPFFTKGDVSIPRAVRVTVVLTALSTLISAALVLKFGGVGALITAAKFDKALAGLYILRVLPAVGAIAAVATFLEARRLAEHRLAARLGLLCALLNAFYVFLWGSRSLLVVVGATIVLGLRARKTRSTATRSTGARPKVVIRLTVAVLLVVATAGGLRVARDNLMHGEVQSVYAEASVWRQVSLGTNATYFDAAMLSFRDWPAEHAFRDGQDFRDGALGVVPRFLWAGKPDNTAPGKWFRQVYEPEKVNGWPMGAAALWYLNFGWLGVVLGGLLSGLFLGAVAAAQRRRPDNGFNTAMGVVIGVYVLGTGWDSDALVRCVIWLGPLWLIARSISRPAARPADLQGRAAFHLVDGRR